VATEIVSYDTCMLHIGHGAHKILGKIVAGIPSFSTDYHEVYKGCALGKYVRAPFPKSDHRSKSILDLIHTDICGPMSSMSIGGKSKYYLSFIDYFSRKNWKYLLTGKTLKEVLKRFQEFKAFVENQIGKRIKSLDLIMEESTHLMLSKNYVQKLGLSGS
jgi:hypothetical protein